MDYGISLLRANSCLGKKGNLTLVYLFNLEYAQQIQKGHNLLIKINNKSGNHVFHITANALWSDQCVNFLPYLFSFSLLKACGGK